MDELTHDILLTLEKLSENVGGLPLMIDNFDQLTNDNLYFEIFQALFQTQNLDALKEHMNLMKPCDRIQILIEILSEEILKMDLSHINGEAISKGDKKHILNFLQLLYEISKMYYEREESILSVNKDEALNQINFNRNDDKNGKDDNNNDVDHEDYDKESIDDEIDENNDFVIDLLQNVDADACMEECADMLHRGISRYDQNYIEHLNAQQIQGNKNQGGLMYKQNKMNNDGYDGFRSNNSVSRISEVSKSKESSEYEHKKVSTLSSQFSGGHSTEKNIKKNSQKTNKNNIKGVGKKNHHGSKSLGEMINKNGNNGDKETIEQQINDEHQKVKIEDKIKQRHSKNDELCEAEDNGDNGENLYDEQVVPYKTQKGPNNYNEVEFANNKIQEIKNSKTGKKGTSRAVPAPKYNPRNIQIRPLIVKPNVKEHPLSCKNSKQGVNRKANECLQKSQGHHLQFEDLTPERAGLNYKTEDHQEVGLTESSEDPNPKIRFLPSEAVYEVADDFKRQIKKKVLANRNINTKGRNIRIEESQASDRLIQPKNPNSNRYMSNSLQNARVQKAPNDKSHDLQKPKSSQRIRPRINNEKNLKEEFENQQKSLYYKQRDEKIRYIKGIYKLIFELEKKKMSEENFEYVEFRKYQNEQAKNLIESIENAYDKKLELLKQNHFVEQNDRKLIKNSQNQLLKTIEKALKEDRKRQIEQLEQRWKIDKANFDELIKDDCYLEQKIVEIYKKDHKNQLQKQMKDICGENERRSIYLIRQFLFYIDGLFQFNNTSYNSPNK